MMLKQIRICILLTLPFLLFSLHGNAQNLTQSVRGQVLDAVSNAPITGATVIILGTHPPLGAITDSLGNYEILQVPLGRLDIRFSYIGYETLVQNGILLTSAKPLILDILLKTSLEELQEVVITPPDTKQPLNTIAKVSARSFSLEESQRFAGGLSDPSRVAYSFAGVTFGAPQDNGVVIRGNSPTNVLWRIEGVEVPGASHFGGGNLAGAGLITIYSANVLGTSDFFTGAFPAEYSNALSGVFDVRFRRGSTDRTKYTAQIGLLGADVAVEGPFREDSEASYLANYRHGFLGYFGRFGGGPEPDYQDLSFKVNLPSKRRGTVSLWGIMGLSSIFTPYGEYEEENGAVERRETEQDFQQDNIDFDMAAFGLNHQVSINNSAYLNTSAAFTTNGYRSLTDWFEPDAETLNTGTLTPFTDIDNRESRIIFTSTLTNRYSRYVMNTAGVTADYIGYRSIALQADDPMEPLTEFLNTTGQTYNIQAFTQYDVTLSPQLTFQAGINVTHFGINEETTWEPRAGLRWKPASTLAVSLGYGRHSRREDPKVYFFDYEDENGTTRTNEHLKRTKTDHFIIGVTFDITNNLRFNIEAYYQNLYDVPVVPDSSFSFINYTQLWELDAPLTNEGTGENMGIDISLERSFKKGFYYLLTASLYDSKFVGGDGIERNTLFNRGYLATLTTGKEFVIRKQKRKRVNLLGVNLNVTYMGGQRLTPFLREESIREEEVILDSEQLYSLQSNPELWINGGITYKINKPNRTVTWGIDLQNATLLEQLQGFEYNFFTRDIDAERVLFVLPNLYYKIEF